MADLYIAEFEGTGAVHGVDGVASMPPLAEQKIAIGGSSTESAAFNTNTSVIRVHADAICSIAIANTGTATATAAKMRLAADQTEYFKVKPGAKLAVITNT